MTLRSLAPLALLVMTPPTAALPQQAAPGGKSVPYHSTSASGGGSLVTNSPNRLRVPATGKGVIECTARINSFQGKDFPVWKDPFGNPVFNSAGNAFSQLENQRYAGARVEVYDSRSAEKPLVTKSSPLIDLPRGDSIDEDGNVVAPADPAYAGLRFIIDVPFSIPMPAREKPYYVKVIRYSGDPKPEKFKDQNGVEYTHDKYSHWLGDFMAKVN
jgi:hypothetical protein